MSYDFDLFVIGGGSGGTRCARIAAGHGARVGVAEERHWGGTCVNVGCVPKKLMVMASDYGLAAQDSHAFGWDNREGRHDWATLIANKDAEIARLTGTYRRLLEGCGATVFESRASFIDPHTLDVGGQRVTAEHIVIATGGHPLRPSFSGAEHVIVSDDAFYLPERPQRVVILGAGYIAVEFSGIFSGLGSKVDLIYRQERPLRGFDEDLREALVDTLTEGGITLHPENTIVSVEAQGNVKRVRLADGTMLEADLVFAAVGRVPLTDTLNLAAAGVTLDGSGAVVVHRDNVTSVSHIFAIGDVTNRMNLTPVAIAEGHALADRLFGTQRRSWDLDRVATAVFSSPPIATVGLTETQAAARGPTDIYITRFTPMRYAMGGRKRRTMMKLVVDQQTQIVLGAHMMGDDAAEIMQGISIAINCRATKADFDRTVGIHPTSAEEFVTLRTRARVAGGPRPAEEPDAVMPETALRPAEMGPAEMGLEA